MSQIAKTSREAMKAKAKRLASADPHTKVDSSTWTPPEAEEGSVQTGMRPLSKRAFKKGGKVIGKADGKKAEFRADRKPRAGGGKLEKYLKSSNADRRSRENENDEMNEMSSEAANSMPKREFLAMDRKIEENARKIKNREQGSNLASAKLKGMAKIPARKEGGRATRYLTPDNLINRDVRMANDEREGVKHIGGLKHGGKAHKFSGGVGENPVGAQNKMMGQAAGMMKKGGRAHKLSGGTLQNYLEAARPELAVSKMMGDEEGVRKRSAGIRNASNKLSGIANAGNAPFELPDYSEMYPSKKHGGKTDGHKVEWLHGKKEHRAHGGKAKHSDEAQDKKLMHKMLKPKAFKAKGGSSSASMENDADLIRGNLDASKKLDQMGAKSQYTPNGGYYEDAKKRFLPVLQDMSHESSGLKRGGKTHSHDCRCHKCWGGKTEKNKGGGVFSGEGYPFKVPGEVKGGRSAHAHGGKAGGKGKMNVNIIIASGHHDKGAMGGQPMPNAPVSPRTPPVGAGAPMPPPGMMPPGGGAPGAGGPPMPPPGMMPRKSGGRTTYPIDSGSGGGEARLEKIKAYGLTPPRKK